MTMKTSIALAFALLLGFASAATAEDDAWPSRPVRLIAASGPGGNPDVLARLLADKYSQALRQAVRGREHARRGAASSPPTWCPRARMTATC